MMVETNGERIETTRGTRRADVGRRLLNRTFVPDPHGCRTWSSSMEVNFLRRLRARFSASIELLPSSLPPAAWAVAGEPRDPGLAAPLPFGGFPAPCAGSSLDSVGSSNPSSSSPPLRGHRHERKSIGKMSGRCTFLQDVMMGSGQTWRPWQQQQPRVSSLFVHLFSAYSTTWPDGCVSGEVMSTNTGIIG